jgi:protein-S-isoprenylcysteine O-methyltransferase Ste14
MMTMPNRSRWLVALSILLVGLVVVIAIAAALAPALLSARIGGEGRSVAGGVIFATLTYRFRRKPGYAGPRLAVLV